MREETKQVIVGVLMLVVVVFVVSLACEAIFWRLEQAITKGINNSELCVKGGEK